MMRLGIAIQETWAFFNEIYDEFQRQYDVNTFQPRSWDFPVFYFRIRQYLYRYDLGKFMSSNDVVFFEWASELLVDATHLPKVCGIVTRLHRYEMYQWLNRVNWDAVDKIILVSEAKKTEFIERYPKQADKVVVVSEAISLERFTYQSRMFNGDIGILCQLIPRKRVYELIITFYELLQQKSDLRLHIAGGMDPAFEDYFYALQTIVIDLGIQDKVTFYGNVKDTWNWYHKIDIFISNSYSEGLQVAPMEAMASGCYCLAHRWRGADELLPRKNLYYTDSELRDKILQYCAVSDAEKMEQKKRMRMLAQESFDINQTVRQVVQAIDDVAEATAQNRKL